MKRLLIVLAIACLFLLACIAIVYAADPIVSQLVEDMTGFGKAQQAQLVKETNVSQTWDGITVTVQQVYADANQVVIGYRVTSADGRRYDFRDAKLTDRLGNNLPPMMGMGLSGPFNARDRTLPRGEGAEVVSFDASRIQGAPSQLNLHLTLTLRSMPPTLGSGEVGPFIFDLSAPFDPGRSVEVQKTITKAWIDVTLERVVITPSGTRAHICYEQPTQDRSWTLIANLDIGDGRAQPAGLVGRPTWTGEKCDRVYFQGARADQSGTWTLTVTELVGLVPPSQPGEQIRWSGPWVFQFSVP